MSMWKLWKMTLFVLGVCLINICLNDKVGVAEDSVTDVLEHVWIITGVVEYEDLQRASHVTVELRDQEGSLLGAEATNEEGIFIIKAPNTGIFSLRAIQSSLTSESKIVNIRTEPLTEVHLTLAPRQE